MDFDDKLGAFYIDGGVDLSEGEKQLLYLSRCLYKNTSLIIWDEPSSNLDPFREKELFTKYRGIFKDSMGVFISHKAGNVEMFDEIIYLKSGRIVEKGSPEELIKKRGEYYELYKKQQQLYEDKF